MNYLRVKDAYKRFPSRHLPSLSGLSGAFPEGRVSTILGPNGAGKTTLLSAVSGLQTLDRGSVCYGNDEMGWCALGRTDVTLFMDGHAGYYPKFTVLQNFRYFASLGSPDHHFKTIKEADEWLDQVGLLPERESVAQTLSKGMLQRLNIAIALSSKAKVLLLDEPTLGLDIAGTSDLCALIKKITIKYSLVTIFASHEVNAIISISDEIFFICNGEIRLRFGNADILSITQETLVEAYFRVNSIGGADEKY